VASEGAFQIFLNATFEHLPLFFSKDAKTAQVALNDVGYRMARQPTGQPMLAIQVGEDAVCIFAKPDMPLPKAKLLGVGAAALFDRFVSDVRSRGFVRAAEGSSRPGMRVETFSAIRPGPIMAVTIMRLLDQQNVLLSAAFPPINPQRSEHVSHQPS
jgi:hypothetical protein